MEQNVYYAMASAYSTTKTLETAVGLVQREFGADVYTDKFLKSLWRVLDAFADIKALEDE